MHDIPGLETTAEAATRGAIAAASVTSVPTTDTIEHDTPDNATTDSMPHVGVADGHEEDDEENDEEDDEDDDEESDDDDDEDEEESDGFPRPDRVAFWEQWRWTRRRCRACDCCERPCRYGPYRGW